MKVADQLYLASLEVLDENYEESSLQGLYYQEKTDLAAEKHVFDELRAKERTRDLVHAKAVTVAEKTARAVSTIQATLVEVRVRLGNHGNEVGESIAALAKVEAAVAELDEKVAMENRPEDASKVDVGFACAASRGESHQRGAFGRVGGREAGGCDVASEIDVEPLVGRSGSSEIGGRGADVGCPGTARSDLAHIMHEMRRISNRGDDD